MNSHCAHTALRTGLPHRPHSNELNHLAEQPSGSSRLIHVMLLSLALKHLTRTLRVMILHHCGCMARCFYSFIHSFFWTRHIAHPAHPHRSVRDPLNPLSRPLRTLHPLGATSGSSAGSHTPDTAATSTGWKSVQAGAHPLSVCVRAASFVF